MVEMGERPASDPLACPRSVCTSLKASTARWAWQSARPPTAKNGLRSISAAVSSRRDELLPVHLEAERDPIGVGECQNTGLARTQKVAINVRICT